MNLGEGDDVDATEADEPNIMKELFGIDPDNMENDADAYDPELTNTENTKVFGEADDGEEAEGDEAETLKQFADDAGDLTGVEEDMSMFNDLVPDEISQDFIEEDA